MEKRKMPRKKTRKTEKVNDVVIVGGGPVGCYCAELLADTGRDVLVIEEHKKIGAPVQCTGIVTKDLFEIIRPHKEFMVNKLQKVKVNSPSGSAVELKLDDAVIDRTKFDQFLMRRAEKKGAGFVLGKKVIGIREKEGCKLLKIKSRDGEQNILKTRIIIGADGPNSVVGKYLGNRPEKQEYWIGVQATVKGKYKEDLYEVFFGDEFPGFFGWVVPESDKIARVGVAAKKNSKKVFDKFVKKLGLNNLKANAKKMQGGLIPIYDKKKIVEKNGIYIVGDAAGQVKATTGGGLVPGLKGAKALVQAIVEGTDYKKELKRINSRLKKSLMIRKVLDKFNDEDYDKLIERLKNPKIQKLLKKETRDNPSRILFKAAIKEPKLLLLSKTIFRAKRL